MVSDALAVERLRTQAALAVRVVDDGNRLGKDALTEPILQKARAASDRRAGDRAQQMRNETAGNPRIEHHRAAAGRHLPGAEPLDRALASAFADLGRVAQ